MCPSGRRIHGDLSWSPWQPHVPHEKTVLHETELQFCHLAIEAITPPGYALHDTRKLEPSEMPVMLVRQAHVGVHDRVAAFGYLGQQCVEHISPML